MSLASRLRISSNFMMVISSCDTTTPSFLVQACELNTEVVDCAGATALPGMGLVCRTGPRSTVKSPYDAVRTFQI